MNISITGGAGFIGSNVARHLFAAGHSPVAIDDLSLGRASNLPPEIPLIVGDAAATHIWKSAPKADVIVHLAGASSTPMFSRDLPGAFLNNVGGLLNVCELGRSRGVRRVVYASTSLIYGNVEPPLVETGPVDNLNFYSLSKYCMEHVARMYHAEFGLECIGLRFMSIYGPREEHKGRMANLVSQFIWDIAAGRPPVVYGDGNQTRDFTSVWDVAQMVERVAVHRGSLEAEVFNVGSGIATSLNGLVAMLARMMSVPVKPEYVPVPEDRRAYNLQQRASLELATRLGYRPAVSLEEGIREILETRLGFCLHSALAAV